ncbi:MAG TPA: trypsin-like peptidase domain-containing protein [Candidatus Paceibacterota bacterium]|nr:trypsin-like peptidase domain-containing protein [Candidatus Paceibacterota bacterium]
MRHLRTALVSGLLAVVFFVPGSVAFAAHETTLADATVNLYCRLKSGNKYFSASGSGVFISDRGVILTNAHVAQLFLLAAEKGTVSGKCYVRTGSPAKETYAAEVLYLPSAWIEDNADELRKRAPKGTGENDFALLYVTDPQKENVLPAHFPSLSIASAPAREGDTVTVAGYPTHNRGAGAMRRKLAQDTETIVVTRVRGFIEGDLDVITLAPSRVSADGISGGPLVNARGEIVGIAVVRSGDVLRAIGLSYIDRTLTAQTGTTLAGMLAEDLPFRAQISRMLISDKLVAALRQPLLKLGR